MGTFGTFSALILRLRDILTLAPSHNIIINTVSYFGITLTYKAKYGKVQFSDTSSPKWPYFSCTSFSLSVRYIFDFFLRAFWFDRLDPTSWREGV